MLKKLRSLESAVQLGLEEKAGGHLRLGRAKERRHSRQSSAKVVGKSADKHEILAPVGSRDHGQQPQALPISRRPGGCGGKSQQQTAGVAHQPPRGVEEQEAQAFGARRQEFRRQGQPLQRSEHIVRDDRQAQPSGVGAEVFRGRLHAAAPKHECGVNLFPMHVGPVLRALRVRSDVTIVAARPRYYPRWCGWLVRLPGLREVATWNLMLIMRRTG